MKVVQVCDIRTDMANGVYKTVAGLATALPRAGVKVESWNLSPTVTTIAERTVNGVRVVDLPTRSRAQSMLRGLPKATRDFIVTRQHDFDLIHFHSVFIANNVHAAALLKVPYIVTSHGGYAAPVLNGSHKLFKKFWLAWHERKYLKASRAVHAVSEAESAEIKARWPELTLRYVPNAIDLPALVDESPATSKDFVFLGRLAIDHKGLDLMLSGFAKFAKHPSSAGFRLILAGPDWRGCRAILENQATAEGIADRIVFTGPIFGDDKNKLLAGARAFVHTSRWEGLPFSVLEAMSYGTPVLVTPETNVAAVVNKYNAGLEVRGEAESIAKGFAAFAQATLTEHRGLRRAARKLVEEHYTWPVVTGQVVEMYRAVLGDSADGGDVRSANPQAATVGAA